MVIQIDINKNIEQNAEVYFEAAKKAKKKLEATLEAVKKLESALEKAKKGYAAKIKADEKKVQAKERKKPEWHEKFRWFVSSSGFLCVGGRDATTNELIIKKHTQPDDIVFHTEMAGSPFFLIKTERKTPDNGKTPSDETIKEAAVATASFSRAWKLGVGFAEVFYVKPEQVSKTPLTGTYLPKGSFMIYGKKNIVKAELGLAIGATEDGKIMCGPLTAVEKNCIAHLRILPGSTKAGESAKFIAKKLLEKAKGKIADIGLDDIIRALPSGGCKIEN